MNAKYQCANCHSVTEIAYTKLKPQTFACPVCSSISKINETSTEYAGKITGSFKDVYASLNETVTYNGRTYYIVGISTKQEKGSYVSWNEYILADKNGDLIFLSHGSDFNSFLTEIPITTELAEQAKLGGTLKYKGSGYDFEFAQYALPIAAHGVFFNNILEESYNRTFQHNYNQSQFLSVEKYGDVTEVFFGEYLNKTSFRKLFIKERESIYKNNNVLKNLVLFFALICLVIGGLHYALNYNNVDMVTYTNSIVKANSTSNQFISPPFDVKGYDKKVKLSFVSEVTDPDIALNVSLVNEKTNATHLTETFKHFNNSQNYASGNEVTFCGVDNGSYHLAFHYTANINKPENTYDVDYKIIIGGVSQVWLYVSIIITLAAAFFYYYTIINRNHTNELQDFKNVYKYKNYEPLKYAGIILGLYIFGNYMFISNLTCNSSKVNTELENANYTGNRVHYIARTYSSSGASHK
ncbi:MAG: DUF4178 domain-containing protein [Myroides sp.]